MTEQEAPARDWEAAARRRLEKLVQDTVERIRDAVDELEREATRNIASAAADNRQIEFQTYPRVAGQIIAKVQTVVFNLKLDNLVDAAADAEAARTEKLEAAKRGPVSQASPFTALAAMLPMVDGWVEGAKENHEALGHRGEVEPCWEQFHPDDIRNMVNDTAREIGVPEPWKKPEPVKAPVRKGRRRS